MPTPWPSAGPTRATSATCCWPTRAWASSASERARSKAVLVASGHAFQARPRVREILGRSSVFVMPCYKEAMSIAAVEARAMGLPVVARKPNGVAEVIEHGTHGFLAADDHEFIGYLARLLSDPALHRRMSQAARAGLERFTWEHSIRRHLELYELARSRVADRGASAMKAPRRELVCEPPGEQPPPAHPTPPSNWGAL